MLPGVAHSGEMSRQFGGWTTMPGAVGSIPRLQVVGLENAKSNSAMGFILATIPIYRVLPYGGLLFFWYVRPSIKMSIWINTNRITFRTRGKVSYVVRTGHRIKIF